MSFVEEGPALRVSLPLGQQCGSDGEPGNRDNKHVQGLWKNLDSTLPEAAISPISCLGLNEDGLIGLAGRQVPFE